MTLGSQIYRLIIVDKIYNYFYEADNYKSA
jgi:hypothetical protein